MMSPNQEATVPKNPKPAIALTGGGSGGHITPLLSLAHAIKLRNPAAKVIYIGLKGEKIRGLDNRYKIFDEVHLVTSGKFRRYHGRSSLSRLVDIRSLLLNIFDFFKVIGGIFGAVRILSKTNPGVVFSKGGFVVVPVGIGARLKKIPIVTHDSDAVPGLANRIIGRWASLHATGQPGQIYSYPKDTIRYTGIPVDERLRPVNKTLQEEYKKQIGAQPDQLLLLIGGAGLGSRAINELVLKITETLFHEIKGLRIIHIAGAGHKEVVSKEYDRLLSKEYRHNVEVVGFSGNFYKYTGAADLIITRAGATTIAELAIQKKAAILIPAAFLAAGHQIKNAHHLKRIGAAEVLEGDITPEVLLNKVIGLLTESQKRHSLEQNIGSLAKPNAANELAQILLDLAETNRAG